MGVWLHVSLLNEHTEHAPLNRFVIPLLGLNAFSWSLSSKELSLRLHETCTRDSDSRHLEAAKTSVRSHVSCRTSRRGSYSGPERNELLSREKTDFKCVLFHEGSPSEEAAERVTVVTRCSGKDTAMDTDQRWPGVGVCVCV